MAKFRRGFRYNRRNYKRGYKLSTRNIYSNRGAKSQASQIAALNRKINKIARKDKPEYKVVNVAPFAKSFTSQTLSGTYITQYQPYPLVGNATDEGMVGNIVHMTSLVLNGYCEYFNSSTTGYHDTESAGCVLRVIAIQFKDNRSGVIPIDQLLQNAGTVGTNYTALAYSPFIQGITNKCRILMDYKTTLTTTRNQKLLKLKIPLGKCRDLRYDNPSQTWSNNVLVYVIAGGLHYDQNFVETLEFNAAMKLVYTDA